MSDDEQPGEVKVNPEEQRLEGSIDKIQKNSNSGQHFDCFIESTFRLGCSHHQD